MRAGSAACALGLILGLIEVAYAFDQDTMIMGRESAIIPSIQAYSGTMPQELYNYLVQTIESFRQPWQRLEEVALGWSALCLVGLIFEIVRKRRS